MMADLKKRIKKLVDEKAAAELYIAHNPNFIPGERWIRESAKRNRLLEGLTEFVQELDDLTMAPEMMTEEEQKQAGIE